MNGKCQVLAIMIPDKLYAQNSELDCPVENVVSAVQQVIFDIILKKDENSSRGS